MLMFESGIDAVFIILEAGASMTGGVIQKNMIVRAIQAAASI